MASTSATLYRERQAPVSQLVGIALLALLLRAMCVAVVMRQTGLDLVDLLHIGDGKSYLAYAHFIVGDVSSLSAYDSRVFPGLPAILALLMRLGLGQVAASFLVIATSAAVVTVAAAKLFKDARLGWLLACVPPIFLICSADLGNETPMLALALLGVLLAQRKTLAAVIGGGVLLGLAGVVRPMAAFVVAALLVWMIQQKRWRDGAIVAGVSLLVVAAALGFVQWLLGDALAGVKVYAEDKRAYGGELFTWPGKSLLLTPRNSDVGTFKLLYVWAHVALLAMSLGLLAWRWVRTREGLATFALVLFVLNTLFLLTVGDRWGFQILPRLTLPALPAMLFAFTAFYNRPGRRVFIGAVAVLAAGSLLVGLAQADRAADRFEALTISP